MATMRTAKDANLVQTEAMLMVSTLSFNPPKTLLLTPMLTETLMMASTFGSLRDQCMSTFHLPIETEQTSPETWWATVMASSWAEEASRSISTKVEPTTILPEVLTLTATPLSQ